MNLEEFKILNKHEKLIDGNDVYGELKDELNRDNKSGLTIVKSNTENFVGVNHNRNKDIFVFDRNTVDYKYALSGHKILFSRLISMNVPVYRYYGINRLINFNKEVDTSFVIENGNDLKDECIREFKEFIGSSNNSTSLSMNEQRSAGLTIRHTFDKLLIKVEVRGKNYYINDVKLQLEDARYALRKAASFSKCDYEYSLFLSALKRAGKDILEAVNDPVGFMLYLENDNFDGANVKLKHSGLLFSMKVVKNNEGLYLEDNDGTVHRVKDIVPLKQLIPILDKQRRAKSKLSDGSIIRVTTSLLKKTLGNNSKFEYFFKPCHKENKTEVDKNGK